MDSKFRVAGQREFGVYPKEPVKITDQHRLGLRWIDEMVKITSQAAWANIWFLGCGSGESDFLVSWNVETLSKYPVDFTFADVQPDSLGQLVANFFPNYLESFNFAYSENSRARFLATDLSNGIPAADGSISGVWFKWALHWLLQPEIIVRELARVLKRGGWAYISTLTIDDVAVSCETFLRSKFLLTDLQARFPQAEITAGVNRVNGAEIWVVNHAAAIDEYFAGHPSAQTYSYFKSPDSTMPKFITGFQPAYFTMTARNYGLNIVGMQLEKNKDFPNGFADNDPRSKSRIHLLLAKP